MNTNITNFRNHLFEILDNTIKYNEVVTISTKNGNAVVVSEDDYKGLIETLYVSSVPHLKEQIIEGMNTPLDKCVPEDEVNW